MPFITITATTTATTNVTVTAAVAAAAVTVTVTVTGTGTVTAAAVAAVNRSKSKRPSGRLDSERGLHGVYFSARRLSVWFTASLVALPLPQYPLATNLIGFSNDYAN